MWHVFCFIFKKITLTRNNIMRIWSIHPRYLDSKGLVALWRETLLAQKVLSGKTKGYTQHPQLYRFRQAQDPLAAIGAYLSEVHTESRRRGYSFDASKIVKRNVLVRMAVTSDQLAYEWQHLLDKLIRRDPTRFGMLRRLADPDPHPVFQLIEGKLEPWEKGDRSKLKGGTS
jgi:pyrimidine dimer DNA glycosylase